MLPRYTILALILAVGLLTAACGQIITNLSELTVVRSELKKKFGDEVSVNSTAAEGGLVFTVWFVNSPLNEQSPPDRLRRATDAADVVKKSYKRIQKVSELWVGFVRQKTRVVVLHSSHIVSVHGFDKNGSPLPGRKDDIVPPPSSVEINPTNIQVTPSYDSRNNITDVSVSGIQLDGEPGGLGLTVLPNFKVEGRVAPEKLPPPQTVTLIFASYAEKPRFKQTTPVSFLAEKKVLLKTEGTFTGRDAQFCYLNIPYAKFHRMVNGKELTIKLGDKEFPLTPSQLAAMHAMTEYVRE